MFNKDIADTQFKNPALLVKCVAARRAGFFMYNIILILVSDRVCVIKVQSWSFD